MPVNPQRELGAMLLDGWEMPEPVWQLANLCPAESPSSPCLGIVPSPWCCQGSPHGARTPPTLGCSGRAWGDLLRCRCASPFLCLIAESGLEGRREVRACPCCVPHQQNPRHCGQPAHCPSSEDLPGPPPQLRIRPTSPSPTSRWGLAPVASSALCPTPPARDDARARLGDSLRWRARAVGLGREKGLPPAGLICYSRDKLEPPWAARAAFCRR